MVFGTSPPAALVERYLELHRLWPLEAGAALPVDVARILDEDLDLEAVELALRWRERDNPLTRKLHALLYLAEVRAAYLPRFVARRDAVWAGVAALARHVLRSAWKLVKGRYLCWRHRVA